MATQGFTSDHRTRSMPLLSMSLTPLAKTASMAASGQENGEGMVENGTTEAHSDRLAERELPPREETLDDVARQRRLSSSLDEDRVYLAAWKGPLTGAISDFTTTLAAGVRRRGTEERSGGDGWRSNSASHVDLTRLAQEATSNDEDEDEDDDDDGDADPNEDALRAKSLGLHFATGRDPDIKGAPGASNGSTLGDHERSPDLSTRLAARPHRPVIFHDVSETEESRDPNSWYPYEKPAPEPLQDYFGGQSPSLVRSNGTHRAESHPSLINGRASSAISLPLYASVRNSYDDITSRTQPTTPGALYSLGPFASGTPHLYSSHHGSPDVHHNRRLPQEMAEAEEHEREIERLRQALEQSVARGKMSVDQKDELLYLNHAGGSGSHPMSKSNSRGHSRRGSSALYPSGSSLNLMTMSQITNGHDSHRHARDTPQRRDSQPGHSERSTPPKGVKTGQGQVPAKEEGLGVWWIDVLHRLFELPLTLAGVEDVGMGKREGLEDSL